MTPPRGAAPTPADDANHAMILGEMRGQLREVVHGLNNLSGKFDGLSREVIGLGVIAKEVLELKAKQEQDMAAIRKEIAVLRSERDQQKGATNLLNWVFKNWPGVVGFVLLIGLILKTEGKL